MTNDAFSSIVGHSQAIKLLRSALQNQRLAPAYLFAGVAGIGRKLTALAFTQEIVRDRKSVDRVRLGNHPDVLWVEPTYLDKGKMLTAKEAEAAGLKRRAMPQIRLEQIREIAEFISRPPLESDRFVVILEDAHTMAEPAANGLLKTLEEPGKATLILIAPDTFSLLPTLVSRCQRIPFYRLSILEMATVLSQQNYADIPAEILSLAQGSPGQAIAAFQQYQELPADLLAAAQHLPKNPREALSLAKQITSELEIESQLWLIDYLQNYFWQQWQSLVLKQDPLSLMQHLEVAKQHLAKYVQPRLVWEVALLKLMQN